MKKLTSWRERHVIISSRKSVFIEFLLLMTHSQSWFMDILWLSPRRCTNDFRSVSLQAFQCFSIPPSFNNQPYIISLTHSNYLKLSCFTLCYPDFSYEWSLSSGFLFKAHYSDSLVQGNHLIEHGFMHRSEQRASSNTTLYVHFGETKWLIQHSIVIDSSREDRCSNFHVLQLGSQSCASPEHHTLISFGVYQIFWFCTTLHYFSSATSHLSFFSRQSWSFPDGNLQQTRI